MQGGSPKQIEIIVQAVVQHYGLHKVRLEEIREIPSGG
jgi:hypothetical protein